MSLDSDECLDGLREAYANNTPEDSDDEAYYENKSPRSQQRSLDVEGIESDEESQGQHSSRVEERLLELLKRDVDLDEDESREKVRRCTEVSKPKKLPLSHLPHAFPCSDTYSELPNHPSRWPQRPVMVRPTAYTSTKIKGIRRASGTEFEHFPGFCEGCILPINNGSEDDGESLVIDFESSHFVGTLLMRIKQAPKNKNVAYQDRSSYFDGKKRTFQAVVKGTFKSPLPMSHCITGQSFERPAGKLPARWIVTSFIKFVSTLAPQLEATIDGDAPRFLTPLVATAHTVLAKPISPQDDLLPQDLEEEVEEPSSVEHTSVMQDLQRDLGWPIGDSSRSSVTRRMKARKKAFNSIAARKEKLPRFSTEKEYTFEFYQHLLDFEEKLAVDMGRPLGKVGLAQATDGQPIKFMSAYQDPQTKELDTLWSFDIWHESLFPYAELALAGGSE